MSSRSALIVQLTKQQLIKENREENLNKNENGQNSTLKLVDKPEYAVSKCCETNSSTANPNVDSTAHESSISIKNAAITTSPQALTDLYLKSSMPPVESSSVSNIIDREESDSSTSSENSSSSDEEDSDDSVVDPMYTPVDTDSSDSATQTTNLSSKSDEVGMKKSRKIQFPSLIEKKGKKRVAKPLEWHKNKSKQARNAGQSYTSVVSKKVIAERKMLPPCTEKCRLKCNAKVTEDDRSQIFKNYWSLNNLQRQRDFLAANMTEIKPKYRYVKENQTINRNHNNAFYFQLNEQKIQVCKQMFKNTLGISDRPIRTVLGKRILHVTGGMISEDLRGRHGKHFKIDEKIKEGVRTHISSIPKIPSHYCRAGTSRQYIEGGRSLADLHRDYQKICKDNSEAAANYMMYSRIFNQEYNLSFFVPKKDQCELCTEYSNSREEEKDARKAKYEIHLKEAKLSREEKEKDKTSENTIVAVFDLQAVLPCPSGQASNFYYVSKLNVFNLTVFNLKNKTVQCFVWHEGEAQRGSNEIGSCIMQYLDGIEESMDAQPDKTRDIDIIFYSDNCSGQQKNKFMIAMYMYVVSKFKYIRSITHKFLITGHSQNEGDNAHSVIEKQISRAKKSGAIYTPEQYYTLIRTAKKTGDPYRVTEICYNDIFDLKALTTDFGWSNTIKDKQGNNFKLTEVKVLKVQKGELGKLLYKTSYEEKEYREINVFKDTRKPRGNANNVILKKEYKKKIGIAEKKKTGLLNLCKKKIIPFAYHDYYKNL